MNSPPNHYEIQALFILRSCDLPYLSRTANKISYDLCSFSLVNRADMICLLMLKISQRKVFDRKTSPWEIKCIGTERLVIYKHQIFQGIDLSLVVKVGEMEDIILSP